MVGLFVVQNKECSFVIYDLRNILYACWLLFLETVLGLVLLSVSDFTRILFFFFVGKIKTLVRQSRSRKYISRD